MMVKIFLTIMFLVFSQIITAQHLTKDTTKFDLKFVPGVKFCSDGFVGGSQLHSNLGFEVGKKNNRFEYFVRNYFNVEIFVGDTTHPYDYIPTNFYYMRNTFVAGTNYYLKNRKFRLSAGLYYERAITYINKYPFFIIPGHYSGLELGINYKFHGVNFALKEQVQLFGYGALQRNFGSYIDVFDANLFSFCIEVPINIRY